MKKRSKPLEDTIELNEDEILANFRALMAQESSKEEMVEREMDLYINVNHIEKETTLPIVIDERKVDLRLPFDCILLAGNLPGMCHILFSHEKSAFDKSNRDSIICECKLLINNDDYKLLFKDKSSLSEIRKFASTYAQLSESQRNFLKEQFSSQKEEEINNDFEPIVDEEGLRLVYNSCKHAYSPEIQKHAGLLFKELDQQRYGSNNRADILLKLSYMLNCKTKNLKKPDPITYEEVMQSLDKKVFGMYSPKKLIADRVMLSQHSGISLSLLLVGNPGVGKTSFCKGVADAFRFPLEMIPLEGSDPIALTGLTSNYAGSLPSVISTAFYKNGHTQMVLLFDEIDKMSIDESKVNPYAVFNTMLAERKLHDEYLGVDIDLSNTVIIATANDTSKIPQWILNRFSLILNVEDYSYNDKVVIAKNYAIPELLKENNISRNDIVFDDETLHYITLRYCDDHGARKIRSCIDSLICSVVSGWTQKIIDKPFRITTEYAKQELDELYLPDKKTSIGFTG